MKLPGLKISESNRLPSAKAPPAERDRRAGDENVTTFKRKLLLPRHIRRQRLMREGFRWVGIVTIWDWKYWNWGWFLYWREAFERKLHNWELPLPNKIATCHCLLMMQITKHTPEQLATHPWEFAHWNSRSDSELQPRSQVFFVELFVL